MDLFLKDVNILLFKQWVMNQHYPQIEIYLDPKNENRIILESEQCFSEVIIHQMNIIELSVKHKSNEEIIFYLHFQMNSMKHSIDLFNEMIDTISNTKNQSLNNVLICCSSGLTSSYFVSKIKEASKLLSFKYQFEASSYSKIHNYTTSYDIILLAPQISYMYKDIHSQYPNKLIFNIPPNIFAKYDVTELINFIDKEIKNYTKFSLNSLNQFNKQSLLSYYRPILSLGISIINHKIYISKAIFINKEKVLDDISIKSLFTINDLINIIDYTLSEYKDLGKICISLPTFIKNNIIESNSLTEFNQFNLYEYLKNQYKDIDIYIETDIHTKNIGYHFTNEYKSIVFIDYNEELRCSSIINDMLIKGDTSYAGDLNYLPLKSNTLNHNNYFQFQDTFIIKTIVSLICILSPEVIVFSDSFCYSLTIIKEELSHYIPQNYIPKLIISSNDLDYLHLGHLVICNKKR